MEIKIMPCNDYHEQLVLSGALNSINAANDVLYLLNEEDFYFPRNKIIFEEMKYIFGIAKQIDVQLLISHVKSKGNLEDCGGLNYILTLSMVCPSAVDFDFYCQELKNLTKLRKLIYCGKVLVENSAKPEAKAEIITQDLFKEIFRIQGISKNHTKIAKEVLDAYSEHGTFEENMRWMRERANQGLTPYTGIPCNYPILDRLLGFFRPGCIYYIGARTSMGKTTFMLNLANGMLSGGKKIPVGIFSLEMPAEILTAKLLCMMADVRFSAYEDGVCYPEEFERILDRSNYVRQLPIYIEDQEDMTISLLRARARRLVTSYGVKVIFIDYLTRIKSDTKYPSKHLQVDEISKGLQSMAKELKVPVICLAQLNRASLQKKEPGLSDFRESGSIEEDCDAALLLHRPDYFDPNDYPGQLHVIVCKNRIRGQLRKVAFKKSPNSELFTEFQDIGEVIRAINTPKPYKENYDE